MWGSSSLNYSGQIFEKDNQRANHIWEFLHSEKVEVGIEMQVKFVENKKITRDMEYLGMFRKEVINVILDIVEEKYYGQAENHFNYLI